MTNRDLEARLRQHFHEADTEASPPSMPTAVLLARREARGRSRRKHLSFPQFLSMQIRFVGWKVWAVQGGLLLAACCWLCRLFGQGYWKEPQSAARLLLCLSVLIFMAVPPFLYRSNRYQMQEVEASSWFSSVQLLMARLIIIGTGDLALLGAILVTAAAKSTLELGGAALSVGFPFLVASSGCLFLLGHTAPRQFLSGSMGMCAILLVGFSLMQRHFGIPLTLSPGWIGICALLIAFCCHQFHHLLHRCAYAEMQISMC